PDDVGGQEEDRGEDHRVGHDPPLVRACDPPRHVRDHEADEGDRPAIAVAPPASTVMTRTDSTRTSGSRAPSARARSSPSATALREGASARARTRAATRNGASAVSAVASRPAREPDSQARIAWKLAGSASTIAEVM